MNTSIFHSEVSIPEVLQWALSERDHAKAVRIYKIAHAMERRYRDTHKDIVNDPYYFASAMSRLLLMTNKFIGS